MRIEWHPEAIADLEKIGTSDQRRIRDALAELKRLDDARHRLAPYSGNLKGYWKLRVGDNRVVCRIGRRSEGQVVLVILLAHRSVAYGRRSTQSIDRRR